jgi:hypothetical protein
MEDLWEHALTVLDDQDVSELYKFRDETGILVKLKKYALTRYYYAMHEQGKKSQKGGPLPYLLPPL